MSKTKKDNSLMDKVKELVEPLEKVFGEDPKPKLPPVDISSGDKEFDNAVKNALKKKKIK